MADKHLISQIEAAQLLSVSKFTIRSWCRRRKLPFYRLGKRVMLDKAEVEVFRDNGRVDADGALNIHAA